MRKVVLKKFAKNRIFSIAEISHWESGVPGPNGPIAKMKENIERPLVLRTTLLTVKEISLLPRYTLKDIFYT